MNTSISFQNSNIDWVGSIPSSWEMKKGKYLFSNKKEINSENQCDNLLSLTLFGVLNKDMESSEGLRPLNYKTYQIFENNDMVFKLIDLENKKTSRVGLVHEKGIMSPVYIRLIPKENSLPKYFYYQYYDLYKKYIFNYLGSGVRSSLNPTDLMEIPLVFPPLPEQTQIVSFLDTKTQKIDELIEKTEKKIELLKEKRTSLINHCVTKGLNPNVEMKDSGVEWIGEIPSHWETVKLKYTIKKKPNNGIFKKREEFGDGVPLVNVGDLFNKNNFINKNKLDKVRVDESELEKFEVQNFDVFFVRSSLKLEGIGVSSMIDKIQEPTVFECHIIRVIPEQGTINPYYFNFFLNSYFPRNRLISISQTVTMTTISQEHITSLEILSPPLTEQTKIVEYLNEQTQKIDSTIEKEIKRIGLLKEYRQSLISEVVTGKIDVRDYNG